MRRFGLWVSVTTLCCGVAASCGSSDEKQVVDTGGGENPGGSGGDGGASGRAGSAGSAGSVGSVGGAGGAAVGDAGNGGVALGGVGGVSAAGEGNLGGQAVVAGQGSGGDSLGGAGGAACCSVTDYQSGSQLLPAACAWELVNSADTEQPQLLGGNLRLSTSSLSENQYYAVPPANLTLPAKLVIEARMQLISGSASTPSRAPANFGFVLGGKKNLLMIAAGEIFLLSAENTKGPAAAVATTDGLHVYRMEVDSVLGNVEVFYDGVSKLTGNAFADVTGQTDFLYFGEGSSFGTGVSDWAYVTHNAFTCGG